MSIATKHAAHFRALWADRFVDTITVDRVDPDRGTFNTSTGEHEDPTVQIYAGGALIGLPDQGDNEAQAGQELRQLTRYPVILPHDAGAFQPDDVVTVTAVNTDSGDTALNGRTLRVLRSDATSYLTKRRLVCELLEDAGRVR